MRLGLLTVPFPDRSLAEVAAWRGLGGLGGLRDPGGRLLARGLGRDAALRRHLAPRRGRPHLRGGKRGRGGLARPRAVDLGLGPPPNPLHPDAGHRERVEAHLRQVIRAAGLRGVPVVSTFVGGDRSLPADDNWARAQGVFPPLLALARDHGVTLAFENCPMIFSQDEWPGGHNVACSPRLWRRILGEWQGVGMSFDPSHLVWQMIDVGRFIREFGGAMVHVHAKDLQIDRNGLYENGVMSLGMGWQVPRMPGLGDLDWAGVFPGLTRAGHDGLVVIEHEDRAFEGAEDKVKRGFLLARRLEGFRQVTMGTRATTRKEGTA